MLIKGGADPGYSGEKQMPLTNGIRGATNYGKNFLDPVTIKGMDISPGEYARIRELTAEPNGQKARYIRIKANSILKCPAWHNGTGGKAWVFLDEIMVF